MKKNLSILILLSSIFLFYGCRLSVSLTGGSVDPRAKTIYIATFPNSASLVNPSLSQEFTMALRNKIQGQTPLSVVNNGAADYSMEGEITGYSITPQAIQQNEVAAKNRLTITVRVSFVNNFDETQNFEQTFSRYADYLSTENFSSVEPNLVADINDVLTNDIFEKAFVNW